MIKRTTKYIASDGTEHDSPQAAAERELVQRIDDLLGPVTSLTVLMRESIDEKLACNPEALRDVVNAYFEDLEGHPDLGCDPAYFDDYYQMDPAIPRKVMEDGILAEATDEEAHRGTSCDKPISPVVASNDHRICAICDGGPGNNCVCTCGIKKWAAPDPNANEVDLGTYRVRSTPWFEMVTPPQGDPDDPTTWSAELPVDHPNYCRPFGTRED